MMTYEFHEPKENVIYRIWVACPKCKKQSQIVGYMIPPPKVNCGDCLMDRTEVVEMKIVAAEQL